MSVSSSSAPDFRDWQIAAVRLLQGVVYADDERLWSIVLNSQSQLQPYLARIGLSLVVDEPEGYAFVRQWSDDDCPQGYEQLPKLMRRAPLGYAATVLTVLLRDEFRRFEENELHDERCVIESDALFDQWKALFPAQHDEVRQRRELATTIHKLEELGFVRKFGENPESWEVRRILKARLSVLELESLKQQLIAVATSRTTGAGLEQTDV